MIAAAIVVVTAVWGGLRQPSPDTPHHAERLVGLENALLAKIESAPNDVVLRQELAHLRFRLGHHSAALEALDQAERLSPNDPYAQLLRGAIAEQSLDYVAAIEFYRSAAERDPKGDSAMRQLETLESWIATLDRCASAQTMLSRRLLLVALLWLVGVIVALRASQRIGFGGVKGARRAPR